MAVREHIVSVFLVQWFCSDTWVSVGTHVPGDANQVNLRHQNLCRGRPARLFYWPMMLLHRKALIPVANC